MPVGIIDYGVYVPAFRLSGDVIARSYGGASGSGERAVANFDEDPITMAVGAALLCLGARDPQKVDGLYFASTTAPYLEKQNAAVVASALDLGRRAFVSDYAGSLRAGISALRGAAHAVAAGEARQVLVTAADMRLAEPGSDIEAGLGDGAAAFLLGSEDVVATIDGYYAVTEEFTDVWRRDDDVFLRSEDARFTQLYGYERFTREAFLGLLEKYGLHPEQIAKVAYHAPDARVHRGLASVFGVKPECIAGGNLLGKVGNCGSALAPMALSAALDEAKPGDRVVVLGYGSGCDAMLLTVTEQISRLANRNRVALQLARKRELSSYGTYLKFRSLTGGDKLNPYTSVPLQWREQRELGPLYAKKCRDCGAVQYPPRRVCWNCMSKDNFDDYKLPKQGTVVNFTKDHLIPGPIVPTVMVVVDLEGGGRFYSQLTDADADEVRMGMPVELTYRRYHEGGHMYNYFWKCTPDPRQRR